MKSYCIFDFGASHGRCMIARLDENGVTMETVNDFENVPVYYANSLYWDILRLTADMKASLRMAFEKCPEICAVGIDTWGCDFALLDKDGKLIGNPSNYRDELRYKYRKELHSRVSEYTIYSEAGANTSNIMGMYHLYGLRQTDARELAIADRMLMIPDLLNYALTGIKSNEYTNATMFLAVNPVTKQWSEKIIDICGFDPNWFGPLTMPGTVLGTIAPEVCEECNVPPVPIIVVATHDSASAVAGIPAAEEDNWCYLSLGTWALFGMESEEFFNSEEAMRKGFATQGGCEGKNNFVNLITGLWVIQQCAQKWKQEMGDAFSWNTIASMAAGARRGIAYFSHDDERFAQPNADMPAYLCQYFAETKQEIPQGTAEMAACVYENLTLILKEAYENLKRLTGKKFSVLQLVGGGSKNALLCQWIADALQIEVKAGPAETASIGNLLLQMKAMGEIESLAEGRKLLRSTTEYTEYHPTRDPYWEEAYRKYMAGFAKQ